jgi:CMP-N-acetylneuraminic acid synthetase
MINKVHALIPVRFGSKRIKGKSLRLLNNKPLIQYCIDNLKKTRSFDNIVINSDHDIYKIFAEENKVDFYKRRKNLATSDSMIDDYIFDYLNNNDLEYLAIINPTSPFMTSESYDSAFDYYLENNFDTLLSCESIQTHCFLSGKAINFSIKQKHPRSQDLEPIKALNFAITIINKNVFLDNYTKNGFGLYSGNIGYFETKGDANIDIDYEDDFQIAEKLALIREDNTVFDKKYHNSFKEYINKDISN